MDEIVKKKKTIEVKRGLQMVLGLGKVLPET